MNKSNQFNSQGLMRTMQLKAMEHSQYKHATMPQMKLAAAVPGCRTCPLEGRRRSYQELFLDAPLHSWLFAYQPQVRTMADPQGAVSGLRSCPGKQTTYPGNSCLQVLQGWWVRCFQAWGGSQNGSCLKCARRVAATAPSPRGLVGEVAELSCMCCLGLQLGSLLQHRHLDCQRRMSGCTGRYKILRLQMVSDPGMQPDNKENISCN